MANSRAGGRSRQAGRPPVSRYRPRDSRAPVDGYDLVDRHLSRATESNAMLRRYRLFLRELCIVGVVLACCGTVLTLGIVAAVRLAGLPPWVAGTLGLMGTGTTVAVAAAKARRQH